MIIWRLATNTEYKTIATLFGLGLSTVGVDTVIACQLLSFYFKIPQWIELQEVVNGFEYVTSSHFKATGKCFGLLQ